MGMVDTEIQDSFENETFAVAFVQHALQGAIKGEREDYDQMVSLMDPSANFNPKDPASVDREAMLVATLGALTEVVSQIDVLHHQALYNSILGMSLWNCKPVVREAMIELVVCLAASSGCFLDACLDMLVCHFMPPPTNYRNRWHSIKRDVIDHIFSALQEIADLIPLAPMRLLTIVERRMPGKYAPMHLVGMYVECMLKLETSSIGQFIGGPLLKAVIDRLVDFDVDIRWEDIVVNDSSKGIFDMEMDDKGNSTDFVKSSDILKGNKSAETLDGLMTLTCAHLELCFQDGRFDKVFETLMESFQRTVLTADKSKFVQFIMFYACSLDPDVYGMEFSLRLMYMFLSNTEPLLRRTSAISYLASYLSRAKFVSSAWVTSILGSLVNWCLEYCQAIDINKAVLLLKDNRIFYYGCQAVMYVLCFRMKSVVADLNLKPLESIFLHALSPLKVCLPSIVKEFQRQAKAVQLFGNSDLLKSELVRNIRGKERLDMFFPFDPYLLEESARFIQPNYEFWAMVRPTYDDCFSDDEEEEEDEDELDDIDDGNKVKRGTSVRSKVPGSKGAKVQEHDSDDDLGYSIDSMSITPKSSIYHANGIDTDIATKMPARLRPSTSPI